MCLAKAHSIARSSGYVARAGKEHSSSAVNALEVSEAVVHLLRQSAPH